MTDIDWKRANGGWAAETPAGRYFITESKRKVLVFGPTPMMPPIIITSSVERAKELAEKEIARAGLSRPTAHDGDEEPCEVCGVWPCAHTDPNTWTWR